MSVADLNALVLRDVARLDPAFSGRTHHKTLRDWSLILTDAVKNAQCTWGKTVVFELRAKLRSRSRFGAKTATTDVRIGLLAADIVCHEKKLFSKPEHRYEINIRKCVVGNEFSSTLNDESAKRQRLFTALVEWAATNVVRRAVTYTVKLGKRSPDIDFYRNSLNFTRAISAGKPFWRHIVTANVPDASVDADSNEEDCVVKIKHTNFVATSDDLAEARRLDAKGPAATAAAVATTTTTTTTTTPVATTDLPTARDDRGNRDDDDDDDDDGDDDDDDDAYGDYEGGGGGGGAGFGTPTRTTPAATTTSSSSLQSAAQIPPSPYPFSLSSVMRTPPASSPMFDPSASSTPLPSRHLQWTSFSPASGGGGGGAEEYALAPLPRPRARQRLDFWENSRASNVDDAEDAAESDLAATLLRDLSSSPGGAPRSSQGSNTGESSNKRSRDKAKCEMCDMVASLRELSVERRAFCSSECQSAFHAK